jgi:hypothetical protein
MNTPGSLSVDPEVEMSRSGCGKNVRAELSDFCCPGAHCPTCGGHDLRFTVKSADLPPERRNPRSGVDSEVKCADCGHVGRLC